MMIKCGASILLVLTLALEGVNCDVSTNDIFVHSLLVKLHDIHGIIGDIRQDVSLKISNLDTTQLSLDQASQELGSISNDSLSIENIQDKTESAMHRISEVKDHITDLQKLHEVIHKLKNAEVDVKELAKKIEVELDSHDSESSSVLIQQQIEKLAADLKKQQEKEDVRQLPYNVIEAVLIREFEKAGFKINELREDSLVNLVVRKVYDHHSPNFDLLTDFAKSLTNKTKTYFVTKALKSELDVNHHDTALSVLELKKIVDAIGVDMVEESEKVHVDDFKEELKESVQTHAKNELMEALEGNTHGSATLKEMMRQVFEYNNDLFEASVLEAMNDSFTDISTDRWLAFARNSAHTEQIIFVCSNIWNMMYQHDQMKSVAVTDMAFTVRETMNLDSYLQVKENVRQQLEKIKLELPLSVKNAAFADKVCLKSKKFGEYLFAPLYSWKFDEDRRNVFTWVKGSKVDSGNWRVEHDGSTFYIKNLKYDEYLYAANDYFIKFDRRRSIFTWMRGNRVTNGIWLIEPAGDDCYIKITEFNEYLIAGDEQKKFDKDRRRVFAALGGKKSTDAIWSIEEC